MEWKSIKDYHPISDVKYLVFDDFANIWYAYHLSGGQWFSCEITAPDCNGNEFPVEIMGVTHFMEIEAPKKD